MSTSYTTEKQHAYQAVTRAALLCRQVQAEMVKPTAAEKEDRSPVTVADYASQAAICQGLSAAFPSDPIVAEEAAEALYRPDQADMLAQVTRYVAMATPRGGRPGATPDDVRRWIDLGGGDPGPRFWTLDPIDGTKGFLRGEQYAVALALIEHGRVQVGALACPNLPLDLDDPSGPRGVVFLAVRGQGAEMLPLPSPSTPSPNLRRGGQGVRGESQPRCIAVAARAEPAGARFVESVEAGHADHAAHQALARALGITRPSVRLDSQAKYGVVARGDAAIYLRLPNPKTPDYRERIWDHAAGVLIVEEAGGRVTDALGRDLDFSQGRRLSNNQGVVVSNGRFHAAIVEGINGIRDA